MSHCLLRKGCIMENYIFKRVDNGTFSLIEYKGDETNVIIPENHAGQAVTVLYDSLFKGHEEISNIQIPNTITDIGAFVFDGCSNLKNISLPSSLLYLWPASPKSRRAQRRTGLCILCLLNRDKCSLSVRSRLLLQQARVKLAVFCR